MRHDWPTPARIRGEVSLTWETLLAAVELYVEEVKPREVAELSGRRLIAAGEALLDKLKG